MGNGTSLGGKKQHFLIGKTQKLFFHKIDNFCLKMSFYGDQFLLGKSGNTKGGSITVQLTSCLESVV